MEQKEVHSSDLDFFLVRINIILMSHRHHTKNKGNQLPYTVYGPVKSVVIHFLHRIIAKLIFASKI